MRVSLKKDNPLLELGETFVHVEVSEIDYPPSFIYSHSFRYKVPSSTGKGKVYGEITVYINEQDASGDVNGTSISFDLESCRNKDCKKENPDGCPVIQGKPNRLPVANVFHTQPTLDSLRYFGTALFKAIFSGFAEQLLQRTEPLHPNSGIYLQLNRHDDLDAIPWEYADYYTTFLVHNHMFVRMQERPQHPQHPLPNLPLRIVAVAPDPISTDLADLHLRERFRNFVNEFAILMKAVNIERVFPPTVRQMDELLLNEPKTATVLHFMGHCGQKGIGGPRELIFEHNDNGGPEYIGTSRLIATPANLRLAFLSAYDSRDVARVLGESGVPYTIGSNCAIPDDLIREFEYEFYKSLTRGHTVRRSMLQARASFQNDNRRNAYIAGAMVLYSSMLEEYNGIFQCEYGDPAIQLHEPPHNLTELPFGSSLSRQKKEQLSKLYIDLKLMADRGTHVPHIYGIKGNGGQEFVAEAMRRMAHLFPGGIFAWAFDKKTTSAKDYFRGLVKVIFPNKDGMQLIEQHGDDIQELGSAIIQQFRNHATCLLILSHADALDLGRKERNKDAEVLETWLENISSVRDSVKILLISKEPLDWLKGKLMDLDGLDDLEDARNIIQQHVQWNLERGRAERPDAVRAHWFAHRYIPKELPPVENNDQNNSNLDSNQRAEADSVLTRKPLESQASVQSEDRDLTIGAEIHQIYVNDIDPLVFIAKALDAGELLEVPYENLEKICSVGRGNYSTVYKANCREHEFTVVVVKEYTDPRDMLHDVQVFMTLGKHKNIVEFHGVTKNPETKQYEIVQEFAERGNMHDFWNYKDASSLTWPAKINMACDLAYGLEYIHEKNIIHRGLDCENVLIRADGSLALTGFSLSGLSHSPLNGARVKEQLAYRGIAQVDLEMGDIYSLGILLWEVLYGKRAFEDNYDPSLLEEIMNGLRPGIRGGEVELPAEGTPPDYLNLYQACWDADPTVWPTISDIVAKLETLRLAEKDRPFNWERLESVWIGYEEEKLTKQITKEIEQLNVEMIPYDNLLFKQKNFRRGGFADIHIGSWGKINVAIKAQTKHRSDIIQEVLILRIVGSHARFVKFYGISRDTDHNNYIIMKLANSSLHEYVHCDTYPLVSWSTKFTIALGIAEGLEFLHARNIIHCDLHSGNVLIDHDDTPRLTDFGLSRTFEEAQRLEFRIKIYGRLGYLAPELLEKPPPPYDYVHDIYGLGVLYWEIASSEYPSHSTKIINPNRLKPVLWCKSKEYQDIYRRCGSSLPQERPGLGDIIKKLKRIQQGVDAILDPNDFTSQESGSLSFNKEPESMRQNLDDLVGCLLSLSISQDIHHSTVESEHFEAVTKHGTDVNAEGDDKQTA